MTLFALGHSPRALVVIPVAGHAGQRRVFEAHVQVTLETVHFRVLA